MISVLLPTRNPHLGRLERTLDGLAAQSLPIQKWELIVVDNGSHPPLEQHFAPRIIDRSTRVVVEPELGLTPARLAGIREARGEVLVFVDDDNVLSPDYLLEVAREFDARPELAAAGGPVLPDWEAPPPAWTREFHGLLALRDLGREEKIARGGPNVAWPSFSPVGAGLAVRAAAARAYATAVAADPRRRLLDRRGNNLYSGGDNDLVFTALHGGGDIAYLPSLTLTHLIPGSRLGCRYLARLNRGIMRAWVAVLALHGQCPWPPISRATLWPRILRAWWRCRSWRGPAEHVRWQGICGQFEGQADQDLLLHASA